MTRTAEQEHQHADQGSGIRVLLLDTPENEGVDFLKSMQRQGMQFVSERVSGTGPLVNALKEACWDVLLVNDRLEKPATDDILSAFRQLRTDTGLLVLSSEPVTVESLTRAYKKGISDVVSSHHPDYSVEVFSRAAERSRRNFQLSQLNQQKFELTRHRDQLMSGSGEALAYLQDGIHVYANEAYLAMLGHSRMDELAVTPFIDIVSTELRDKVKQQLLDFQHKARLKSDPQDMAIEELFVTGSGEKDGILQLHATFKTVVYDGEDCIQVVLRDRAGDAGRDAAATHEGLGYPLFVSHLDNFIAEAQNSGSRSGHVIHISGQCLERYIAQKGYGSLNGKMKALFCELKAGLDAGDFIIRFTESSLLILLKGDEPGNAEKIRRQEKILVAFSRALNSEAGIHDAEPAITFTQAVNAVDPASESAEQLVKTFLLGTAATADGGQADKGQTRDNVVPFGKHNPGFHPAVADELIPVLRETVRTDSEAGGGEGNEPQDAAMPDTETAADFSGISEAELEQALKGSQLALYYEAVISVTDIETEFYALSVRNEGDGMAIDRCRLGAELGQHLLAGKLDRWALQHAVDVIAGLYDQGQEYRIRVDMTARSLAENRLPDDLKLMLADSVLPPGMVILDFALADLLRDMPQSLRQLAALKEAGARLSVSGVTRLEDIMPLQDNELINLVNLDSALVAAAAADATAMKSLAGLTGVLHDARLKVSAADISGSELLSACCKARLDLVQGSHIQSAATPLSVESLSQAIAI